MRLFSRYRVFVVAASAALGLCAVAVACNVPVFRFALERWRADAYQVILFHRGPLTEAQRELIRPLEQAQERGLANVVVEVVDASELEKQSGGDSAPHAALRDQVWSRLEADRTLLVVQYPANLRIPKPAWVGPPDQGAIARLIDSPVRQELVRRLASGQTAVWLLLETGDAAKDGPAAELLEDELKKLEKSLELPELTAAPEDKLLSDKPLEISFSVIRVPRSSIEEAALVAMLIGSEEDLAERKDDPMVFPVFGRGRALLALIGPGITAKNIHDSAAFLVGACSCEIKEQNPGFDLLLSVDWDSLLLDQGVSLTAAQTRLTTSPPAEPELVQIPSGAPPAPQVLTAPVATTQVVVFNSPLRMWWVVGGVGILLVLLVGAIVAASQASRQG